MATKMKVTIKKLLGRKGMNVLRRSSLFFRYCLGKDVYFMSDDRRSVQKIGGRSDGFGEWFIVSELLSSKSVVYSVGVGDDISFDKELISKYDVTVHAFDPTPESHQWLKEQDVPQKFVLHKIGLADHDGFLDFHPASTPGHVSHSIFQTEFTTHAKIQLPVKRLETIMAELGHSKIDLLKMDIEGAEYGVIDDFIDSKVVCRQLLIEFHHRTIQNGIEKTRSAIRRLRENGFRLVKMAPNGEEYCFIHRGESEG
jgi:FkbM family methyltransferase